MEKVEIKNLDEKVIYSHTCENNNLKITLEKAVSEGAYLYKANLYGAYLNGANLEGADLNGANLNRADLYGT